MEHEERRNAEERALNRQEFVQIKAELSACAKTKDLEAMEGRVNRTLTNGLNQVRDSLTNFQAAQKISETTARKESDQAWQDRLSQAEFRGRMGVIAALVMTVATVALAGWMKLQGG